MKAWGYLSKGLLYQENIILVKKKKYLLGDIKGKDVLVFVTPIDPNIWKMLYKQNMEYASLGKRIYTYMQEYVMVYENTEV